MTTPPYNPPSTSYPPSNEAFPAFSFTTAHQLSPNNSNWQPDANGYYANKGYTLYGRHLLNEMLGTQDAYSKILSAWSENNYYAKEALVSDAGNYSTSFRTSMLHGMQAETDAAGTPIPGYTHISSVPTTYLQQRSLHELADQAKSLMESPEIDATQNSQFAAGLSAAMGGGHNAATAIADNITFEQKLEAKKVSFSAYAQAVDAYYKTYTATASQIGLGANEKALTSAVGVPTVVPFESQLASDIYANWQDTINTGQMRDQQIRQTLNGANAMKEYWTVSNSWVSNSSIVGQYTADTTAAVFGIRSQYKAASTF